MGKTVTVLTYPIRIDYTSPVWSEIQKCIHHNIQNTEIDFIFRNPLINSSLSQHPQNPRPNPNTPEFPTTTSFQMTL